MYLILGLAAFLTSLISGVLSMAGGMILMGIFSFLVLVVGVIYIGKGLDEIGILALLIQFLQETAA